ncbi:hypothetical protein Ssi03_51880 [Sphaerisporangium siamense]|uniref:Uncharacterized protein n=1 Tax=Sphaerisporangium siamense TaxID=795645 RepID=A0A7W7D8S6_9ACTN|nr:hypothetical protein [Sphaerisporangium siamense]MBB4702109.1 hypothetical protein [Sphaerisporangium siamense]GII87198.1 hypothetical protein Ssi03_51880 [Sphaerisporangium siamense]
MAPEQTSQSTRPPAWPEMPPPPPPPPAPPAREQQRSFGAPATAPHPQQPPRPPESYAPRPTGPHPTGPQPTGPQPTGPHQAGPHQTGPQHMDPRQMDPRQMDPRQMGAQHTGPQARPYVPPGTETTMRVPGPATRPGGPGPGGPDGGHRPGHQPPRHQGPAFSPEDPDKPFVTAGQISGPKTPPPERQQELWNTVFGENYEAIGEEADGGDGRKVWLIALVASVAVALVLALLWAFLAGPLSSSSGSAAAEPTAKAGTGKPKASPSGTQASTKPQSIGRLPKYSGEASPRIGALTDRAGAVTVPRLGGPWQLDTRAEHVRATYGFATRQYVPAGTDGSGAPVFAQIMTGPLAKSLAGKYSASEPAELTPVISAVAFAARNKFFPAGNKVVKTAEQRVSAGGMPARLVAYQVLAGGTKTTLVVAAASTGADVPAIVYMAVPASKKELLPDVNTVFSSIRPAAATS